MCEELRVFEELCVQRTSVCEQLCVQGMVCMLGTVRVRSCACEELSV